MDDQGPVELSDPIVREILGGVLRANKIRPLTEIRVVLSGSAIFCAYQTDDLQVHRAVEMTGIRVDDGVLTPDHLTPAQQEFDPAPAMQAPWKAE